MSWLLLRNHGSRILEKGDAHSWPGYVILYSRDDTVPVFSDLRGQYEDLFPTILELMDVDVPSYVEGSSLLTQSRISSRLRSLGYF